MTGAVAVDADGGFVITPFTNCLVWRLHTEQGVDQSEVIIDKTELQTKPEAIDTYNKTRKLAVALHKSIKVFTY